jgi:hypothetical protein
VALSAYNTVVLAHHDSDFPEQLHASIVNAIATLTKVGLNPDLHCRTYTQTDSDELMAAQQMMVDAIFGAAGTAIQ